MIKYEDVNLQEMNEIAKLHIKCFPDYFLTKLDGGNGKLLSKFYECSLGEGRILVVAKDDGKIIGMVMGYDMSSDNPRELFEKKAFWLLSRRMLVLLLSFNKMAWARVVSRIKAIFIKPKSTEVEKKLCKYKGSSLLSICVLPEYRGQGVAVELMRRYEEKCIDSGIDYYILSALRSNDRGNAFYKKLGFRLRGQDKVEYYYYKMLNGIEFDTAE